MTKHPSMTGTPTSAMMASPVAYARFAGIRPTAIERQRGRLLRAPDHDAGTGGGDSAPTPAPSPAPAASDPPADPSPTPAPSAPAGDPPASEPETSLLGDAVAKKEGDPDPADPAAQGDPNAPKDPPAPEHVVPDAYELTVEGLDLDAAAIEEATPVFKELGLSNDQANKLMPEAAKFRDRVADATLQSIVDAGAKQKADWAEATRSDPDIGGGKLDESLHLSAKALDALGYPTGHEFRQALTDTGFGNHPEMVRMMRRIGEMVSEDGFPRPGATPASQLSPEKRLYPND